MGPEPIQTGQMIFVDPKLRQILDLVLTGAAGQQIDARKLVYSYRIASSGSTREARRAGR